MTAVIKLDKFNFIKLASALLREVDALANATPSSGCLVSAVHSQRYDQRRGGLERDTLERGPRPTPGGRVQEGRAEVIWAVGSLSRLEMVEEAAGTSLWMAD